MSGSRSRSRSRLKSRSRSRKCNNSQSGASDSDVPSTPRSETSRVSFDPVPSDAEEVDPGKSLFLFNLVLLYDCITKGVLIIVHHISMFAFLKYNVNNTGLRSMMIATINHSYEYILTLNTY